MFHEIIDTLPDSRFKRNEIQPTKYYVRNYRRNMQNKPNVKYAQINVNSYMKSIYEKLDTWLSGKNKANSNPNKPNGQKAKMNVNLTLTTNYRKKDDFSVRINKPNFVKGPK
jgi:DNA-binding transcriptional regulator GbsR (MarR family)